MKPVLHLRSVKANLARVDRAMVKITAKAQVYEDQLAVLLHLRTALELQVPKDDAYWKLYNPSPGFVRRYVEPPRDVGTGANPDTHDQPQVTLAELNAMAHELSAREPNAVQLVEDEYGNIGMRGVTLKDIRDAVGRMKTEPPAEQRLDIAHTEPYVTTTVELPDSGQMAKVVEQASGTGANPDTHEQPFVGLDHFVPPSPGKERLQVLAMGGGNPDSKITEADALALVAKQSIEAVLKEDVQTILPRKAKPTTIAIRMHGGGGGGGSGRPRKAKAVDMASCGWDSEAHQHKDDGTDDQECLSPKARAVS